MDFSKLSLDNVGLMLDVKFELLFSIFIVLLNGTLFKNQELFQLPFWIIHRTFNRTISKHMDVNFTHPQCSSICDFRMGTNKRPYDQPESDCLFVKIMTNKLAFICQWISLILWYIRSVRFWVFKIYTQLYIQIILYDLFPYYSLRNAMLTLSRLVDLYVS